MRALSAALWADCCDGVDGDVANGEAPAAPRLGLRDADPARRFADPLPGVGPRTGVAPREAMAATV